MFILALALSKAPLAHSGLDKSPECGWRGGVKFGFVQFGFALFRFDCLNFLFALFFGCFSWMVVRARRCFMLGRSGVDSLVVVYVCGGVGVGLCVGGAPGGAALTCGQILEHLLDANVGFG